MHIWTLLIQAYCDKEKIPLNGVVHDPESDLYSAIATQREPLEKIALVIKKLTSDSSLFEKAHKEISHLDEQQDDGDLSTEEFLEWMDEAGYNMNNPKIFTFDLDDIEDEK